MGWKPKNSSGGAPIPMGFDFDQYTYLTDKDVPGRYLTYLGPRFETSSLMHEEFARNPHTQTGYTYKFGAKQKQQFI